MKSIDYFKYALRNKKLDHISWYFETMNIPVKGQEYKNFKLLFINEDDKHGQYQVLVNDQYETIEDRNTSEPLINFKEQFELDNALINDLNINIEGPTITSIGRMITNYVLSIHIFGNVIPYLNKKLTPSDFESYIAKALQKDEITIEGYKRFVNACSFLQNLSKIVTIAATEKNISAPPGLDTYKKEVMKNFNEKYGEDWKKDPVLIAEYTETLAKFDLEYLKDDPTMGKIMTKKIVGNARRKMYITTGMEVGFDPDAKFVENSLLDGYPKNNDQLASVFNTPRNASYNRGHGTQKGGAVAKDFMRTSISIEIIKGDCGSKVYKEVFVTKELIPAMDGLTMLNGTQEETITDPASLVGKTIKIRSPLYCNLKGKKFCGKCVGKNIENRKNGANLLLTDISHVLLNASLKAMHNTQIVSTTLNINDIIK